MRQPVPTANGEKAASPRGVFVVFEGGDSVGKSTQVGYLVRWLEQQGVNFVQTRQPGGTALGAHIRGLVLDPANGDISPWAESLLFAADKAQHVHEVIEPALSAGQLVVCDRYVDSTLAYQGAGRQVDLTLLAEVSKWATGGLMPDLTVLLDADPVVAVGRIHRKDRLEGAGLAFHRAVRDHFLRLAAADEDRYLVIEALGDREEIAAKVAARVRKLLEERSETWQAN